MKPGYYTISNVFPTEVWRITKESIRRRYIYNDPQIWVRYQKKYAPKDDYFETATFSEIDPVPRILATVKGLRERAEKVLGGLHKFEITGRSIMMRALSEIKLHSIIALSEEFGTDAINFNFGYSGEPGYSEYTPSSPGSAGYIEIVFPIKGMHI